MNVKEEFNVRFGCAKAHRNLHEDDLREGTKFGFNGRESEWVTKGRKKNATREEIFDESAAELNLDFGGDLFSVLTPENRHWVKYGAENAPEDVAEEAAELALEHGKAVEGALKASNYYDEAPTAFIEAGLGNIVLWSERPQLSGPIVFEAIPSSSCYFTLGTMGIEDRFRCRQVYARELWSIFPDPGAAERAASTTIRDRVKRGKGEIGVIHGFWRDYSDVENPVWHYAIRVEGEVLHHEVLPEEGAVNMLCGRFNPRPGSAWGWGPLVRGLPTIRKLDAVARMVLEGMDRTLDPAYTYIADGMLDLSEGIESGVGYPVMPGFDGDPVKPIGDGRSLDYGFFEETRLKEHLSRIFYRPPEQKGKTPPSATQNMNDEGKVVRRMTRPAGKLWQEFAIPLLRRVEYLEREVNKLTDVVLDGNLVTMRPRSPLEVSQAHEEVLQAQGLMEMAVASLGDQAGLVIDGPRTFTNIKARLNDELVALRSEDQIMKILAATQQQAPQQ